MAAAAQDPLAHTAGLDYVLTPHAHAMISGHVVRDALYAHYGREDVDYVYREYVNFIYQPDVDEYHNAIAGTWRYWPTVGETDFSLQLRHYNRFAEARGASSFADVLRRLPDLGVVGSKSKWAMNVDACPELGYSDAVDFRLYIIPLVAYVLTLPGGEKLLPQPATMRFVREIVRAHTGRTLVDHVGQDFITHLAAATRSALGDKSMSAQPFLPLTLLGC